MPRGKPAGADQGAARKQRKPRAKRVPPGVGEAGARPDQGGPHSNGRLASDIPTERVEWLLKPYVARGNLSVVAGPPSVGKSTFVAHVVSRAAHAIILPGYEESVGAMTLTRLKANGVRLDRVRFLDDRPYHFPRDKQQLIRVALAWEADLIVFDPLDSYVEDGAGENDGPAVRGYLESLFIVAQETGAAIFGVRHPGKDPSNIMPGSRQWGAVSKSIIKLSKDGSLPPRYLLTHHRDAYGNDAPPRYYNLVGARGEPKRFEFADELDAAAVELAAAADGPAGRRKVLEACKLIRHLFELDEAPQVAELVNQCRNLGIGEHARDEAKRVLGIECSPAGRGEPWRMSRTQGDWPEWLPGGAESQK